MSSFLKKVRIQAKRQFRNEYEGDAYNDSIENSPQTFSAEIRRDGDKVICEFTKSSHEGFPVDSLKIDITPAFADKDLSWVTTEEDSVDFDGYFDLSNRKFNYLYLKVPQGKKKLDAMKILDLKAPGGKTVRDVFDDAIAEFNPRDDEDYGSPDGFANDNDYYSWRFGGKKW